MHRFAPLLFVLLPLAAAGDEPTDVIVPGESRVAASRLAEARKLIVQKKWREATTLLSSVSDTGTELASLPNGRFVQARLEAQRRLSRLPPRVLDDYCRRAEPQAKRWLQQGLDES